MSTDIKPRYSEIWMVSLDPGNGSVQSGYRPAWIASNDINNTYSPTVNIIPITSKIKKNLPIHITIEGNNENGLSSTSTLLVEQIMTVPASALYKCIGKITDPETIKKNSTPI